jgi:ATP-dependent RNA helicase DDX10/DBP4
MKETTRLETTDKFSKAKHSCLFTTDVVARGLDFPAVDWVVQVDCPEDADTYIHRVGRTARYEREGRAILFLDPSEEEGMLTRLEQKKIPIERINVRAKKQQTIKNQLQKMCFEDPHLKQLGMKAFKAYVMSLHIQKDKDVFQLEKYPLEEFASSLGLPGAPRIKFLKADAEEAKRKKNMSRQALQSDSEDDDDDGELEEGGTKKSKKNAVRTKYDRMFERQNQDILADHNRKLVRDDDDDDIDMNRLDGEQREDEDLFSIKRRIPADDSAELSDVPDNDTLDARAGIKKILLPGTKTPLVLDSKRREKLLQSKKKLTKLKDKGSKLVFDDDGNAHEMYELEDEADFRHRGEAEMQRKQFVEAEVKRVQEADVRDKALAKEKKRAKIAKRKEKERAAAVGGDDESDGSDGLEDGRNAFRDFLQDLGGERDSGDDDDDGESGGGGESEDDERPAKREKKWFQEKGKRKDLGGDAPREIETLDDLEAAAASLLGSK